MKVEDQLSLILAKLDDNSKGIAETNRRLTDVHDSVEELKSAKLEFEQWRRKVDGQVADLRDYIALPFLHYGFASHKVLGSPHLDPTSSKAAPWPLGHGDETHHRSDGSGYVYTTTHEAPPVKGTKQELSPWNKVLNRRLRVCSG
jgi:hypothetical protein